MTRQLVNTMIILLSLGLLGAGCSKPKQPDSVVLQGTWRGEESGGRTTGLSSLMFDGTKCEFHGANPQEWYKATFTLREDTTPKQLEAVVIECPFSQYVGKTVHGIYKIEDAQFTFTANEPGNPAVPASFDAPGARKFVMARK